MNVAQSAPDLDTQNITERKRAEEERTHRRAAKQAARAEAEAALEVRNTLLSIASHDLRMPLTAVQGYATILQNRLVGRPVDEPQAVRLADMLLRQVDRIEVPGTAARSDHRGGCVAGQGPFACCPVVAINPLHPAVRATVG